MTVYTVLVEDRHADPAVTVFGDQMRAVLYAQDEALKMSRSDDDIDFTVNPAMRALGIIWSASVGPESDRVTVSQTELR